MCTDIVHWRNIILIQRVLISVVSVAVVEQYLVSGDSFRSVYTFFYQFFRVSFVKKSAFQ